VLVLPWTIHDQMIAHAVRGLPHEACGLFAAEPSAMTASPSADPDASITSVVAFHPMRNAAASSQIYQLDGAEMLDVEAAADAKGQLICGVMHSHTHTSAYPSPTDVRDAAAFDPFGTWHYVIVSLRHPEPALRSYRIVNGKISEEAVVLEP
jgi:[CysO sulfur-carrier protein]-S-L-cysteine hydrolase